MLHKFLSPPENHIIYGIMWKNTVQPDQPQMTIQCCAEKMQLACQVIRAQIQTHTIRIPNTYCFSTASMVMPTHLNAMVYVPCLPC